MTSSWLCRSVSIQTPSAILWPLETRMSRSPCQYSDTTLHVFAKDVLPKSEEVCLSVQMAFGWKSLNYRSNPVFVCTWIVAVSVVTSYIQVKHIFTIVHIWWIVPFLLSRFVTVKTELWNHHQQLACTFVAQILLRGPWSSLVCTKYAVLCLIFTWLCFYQTGSA